MPDDRANGNLLVLSISGSPSRRSKPSNSTVEAYEENNCDTLADLTLLKPICEDLGSLATLHIVETADHSFHMLKKSGKTDTDALRELAQTTASWQASKLN